MRARRFRPNVDGCMALEPRLLLADPAAFIGFDSGSADPDDPTGHTWWNSVGGNTEVSVFASYDVSTIQLNVDGIVLGTAYYYLTESRFPRGGGQYNFPVYGLAWDYHIPFYWDENPGLRHVDVLVNYANGETPDWDAFDVHVEAPSAENFEITSGTMEFGLWTMMGDRVIPFGSAQGEFSGIGFSFSATQWQDMRYSFDATNSTRVGGWFGFVQLVHGDARVEYSDGATWSVTSRDFDTGEQRDVMDASNSRVTIFYNDYRQEVNGGPVRVPPPNITIRDYPGLLANPTDGPYPHLIFYELSVTTYAVWLPWNGIPIVVGVGGWDQTGLARNNRVVDDPSWENAYGVTAASLWDTSGSFYNPPNWSSTGFTALLPEWRDNSQNTLLNFFWPGDRSPSPGIAPDADPASAPAPDLVAGVASSLGTSDALAYVNPFAPDRRRGLGGALFDLYRRARPVPALPDPGPGRPHPGV